MTFSSRLGFFDIFKKILADEKINFLTATDEFLDPKSQKFARIVAPRKEKGNAARRSECKEGQKVCRLAGPTTPLIVTPPDTHANPLFLPTDPPPTNQGPPVDTTLCKQLFFDPDVQNDIDAQKMAPNPLF